MLATEDGLHVMPGARVVDLGDELPIGGDEIPGSKGEEADGKGAGNACLGGNIGDGVPTIDDKPIVEIANFIEAGASVVEELVGKAKGLVFAFAFGDHLEKGGLELLLGDGCQRHGIVWEIMEIVV